MKCDWCREVEVSIRARFCGRKCRQSAFRLRRRIGRAEAVEVDLVPTTPGGSEFKLPSSIDRWTTQPKPLRFAYADPPYPGMARRFYGDRPEFKGEVDHVALLASLTAGAYAGWALSTSAKALRDLLPLCPPEARVCAWVKPHGAAPATFGLHNVWEPVIVVQGRRLRPGRRDALWAHAARGGGELPGRKPIAFCAWLFDALGMLPGDSLDDLFPGTGIVSRSWAEASLVDVAPRGTTT